jgi:hypothetical protein
MSFMWPGRQADNFYINPSTGNDANSGRKSSLPKRTYAACRLLALLISITVPVIFNSAAATTIPENITADIAGSTFTRYGAGANPIYFGGKELIGNTWANLSSGRWSTTITTPSSHSVIQTLRYNTDLPVNKQANQAAVTTDGQWFSSNSAGVTTITVWSLSANPNDAFTSITVDYEYGFNITANNISLYHINSQRGYEGIRAINCVGLKAYDIEVGYTGQHGTSWDNGCYEFVLWDYNVYRTGVGPTQGCHGLSVGASGAGIVGGGHNVFNMTVQFAGEDCMQVQSNSLGTVVNAWNTTLFNGYENCLDTKCGLVFMFGGVGDQRGTFTTASPLLLHLGISTPSVVNVYDFTVYGRDQSPSNLQSGINYNDGCTGSVTRCLVIVIDGAGVSSNASGGPITVIATEVRKAGVGSVIDAFLLQFGTGNVLLHCTAAPAPDVSIVLTGLRINSGVTGSSKNCIWGVGNTSTTRYCIDNQGTWVSTNDLFWKGETTAVCIAASTKKTAAQTTAGFTTSGLTVSGAKVFDPLFTNLATGDLTPQATSPAKAGGTATAAVFLDRNSKAYRTPPDIGALNAA